MSNNKLTAAWLAGVAGALLSAGAAAAQTARDPLRLEPSGFDAPRRDAPVTAAQRAPEQRLALRPFVGVRTLVTDNAYLTSSDKVTDLIINPFVGVTGNLVGPRTSAYVDMSVGYDSYSRAHQLNGVTYTGMARAEYDIVPRFLMMEGFGSVENGNTSVADLSAIDRSGVLGRAQVINLAAGPRVTTTVGDLLDVQATARIGWVSYRPADGSSIVGGAPPDSTTQQVNIGATTGERFSRQEFRVSGIYEADDNDFRRYTGLASVFVPVSSNFRLLARGGADDIEQGSAFEIQSPIWSVGFEYDLNADSYIRIEGGRRYHDSNFAAESLISVTDRFYLFGSFTHQILPPQLALQDNFLSFVSNSQTFPAPLTGGDFQLRGPLYSEISKDKVGLVNAVYTWLDQSFSVQGVWTRRLLLLSNQTDETVSATVSYSRRMRPDLRGEVSLEYDRQLNNASFGHTDRFAGRVTLVYDLNPSVQFTGGYAYSGGNVSLRPVGLNGVAGADGGVENVLFATMVKKF